jgi:hypothetical protein
VCAVFDELHFTGAFQHLEPTIEEEHGHVAKKAVVSHIKRAKAEVCRDVPPISPQAWQTN